LFVKQYVPRGHLAVCYRFGMLRMGPKGWGQFFDGCFLDTWVLVCFPENESKDWKIQKTERYTIYYILGWWPATRYRNKATGNTNQGWSKNQCHRKSDFPDHRYYEIFISWRRWGSWRLYAQMGITDCEPKCSRVQMKRFYNLERYDWLLRNKQPIEIGAQIAPPNPPIGRIKNIKTPKLFHLYPSKFWFIMGII